MRTAPQVESESRVYDPQRGSFLNLEGAEITDGCYRVGYGHAADFRATENMRYPTTPRERGVFGRIAAELSRDPECSVGVYVGALDPNDYRSALAVELSACCVEGVTLITDQASDQCFDRVVVSPVTCYRYRDREWAYEIGEPYLATGGSVLILDFHGGEIVGPVVLDVPAA